jgi:hypothetical protein
VAQPADLLLGIRHAPSRLLDPEHTTYLTLPLWLGALLGLVRGGRGRAMAAWLATSGLVIAAGPQLVLHDTYQQVGGRPYLLPMHVLEALGYPLGRGGQYYRAIAVASLGVGLLAFLGLERLRGRRAQVAAGLLTAFVVLDSLRATGPWPRPIEAVPHLEAARALGRSMPDGAVLTLPLVSDTSRAGEELLLATLHHRPVEVLAQTTRPRLARMQHPWLESWERSAAAGGDSARAWLHGQGFRYVWSLEPADEDSGFLLDRPHLTQLLGAPERLDGTMLWDLGPVEP